ncbi:MAG: tRNA (adenosine(37)-N6)-threonylcarbamoyltransferase complex ATPase subunit type 1 TsaE [Gallionella sp.]|nr:tRNA (adenosine(37)-N6)-threonylcarbamoyltransferase complex ATPase subunit type 1 TsaE [Gallionella sp.]
MHSTHHSRIQLELADETATLALGARLAGCVRPGLVIYLYGDLGAGKTTLVRGLLAALGYLGKVKSPTYTLLEPYRVDELDLRHFDLYRLTGEDEWESAGFRDEFDGARVLLIEWPEKAAGLLPAADINIHLAIGGTGRSATLQSNTETGDQCLKQF